MAKVEKITLSPSRDIPFNKLVLSQANVRRVKAGISVEQLAESIAQRTLLQSLNFVRSNDPNESAAQVSGPTPSPDDSAQALRLRAGAPKITRLSRKVLAGGTAFA